MKDIIILVGIGITVYIAIICLMFISREIKIKNLRKTIQIEDAKSIRYKEVSRTSLKLDIPVRFVPVISV